MTTVIDHTVTQPMSTTTPRHLQSQCHFTEHDFLNRHCIYVYYYIFFHRIHHNVHCIGIVKLIEFISNVIILKIRCASDGFYKYCHAISNLRILNGV